MERQHTPPCYPASWTLSQGSSEKEVVRVAMMSVKTQDTCGTESHCHDVMTQKAASAHYPPGFVHLHTAPSPHPPAYAWWPHRPDTQERGP